MCAPRIIVVKIINIIITIFIIIIMVIITIVIVVISIIIIKAENVINGVMCRRRELGLSNCPGYF